MAPARSTEKLVAAAAVVASTLGCKALSSVGEPGDTHGRWTFVWTYKGVEHRDVWIDRERPCRDSRLATRALSTRRDDSKTYTCRSLACKTGDVSSCSFDCYAGITLARETCDDVPAERGAPDAGPASR